MNYISFSVNHKSMPSYNNSCVNGILLQQKVQQLLSPLAFSNKDRRINNNYVVFLKKAKLMLLFSKIKEQMFVVAFNKF